MVGYADLDAATVQLGLSATDPDHNALIGRLAQVDDEVSRLIDLKTGRSFGGNAGSLARQVPPPPSPWNRILSLPFAVRSVTAIELAGPVVETLAPGDWALCIGTELTGDYHGIERIDGGVWPVAGYGQIVTVTGLWSDQADGQPVPPEIVAAATFLACDEWRLRESSPSGEIGADGLTIRPRNPWNYQIVKLAIDRYRVATSQAGF